MTVEEIKKEIERMQDVTKDIKVSVGNLRSDINQLEGAIKQDNDEFEAQLSEAESRGYQRGYEAGFAEGRTRKELSEKQDKVIRIGDEVRHLLYGYYGIVLYKDLLHGTVHGVYLTDQNQPSSFCWEWTDVVKTDRHIEQAESLMGAIR